MPVGEPVRGVGRWRELGGEERREIVHELREGGRGGQRKSGAWEGKKREKGAGRCRIEPAGGVSGRGDGAAAEWARGPECAEEAVSAPLAPFAPGPTPSLALSVLPDSGRIPKGSLKLRSEGLCFLFFISQV